MISPRRQSLVELLRASGVEDSENATALATLPATGGSWTVEVLNSGKVDEVKFASELGKLFNTPVEIISTNRIDKTALSALPSRFVFKHQILPLGTARDTVRLATYDVFNSAARRLAAQLLPGKQIEWVLVPRDAAPAHDQDALRRGRGDVRGDPADDRPRPTTPGTSGRRRMDLTRTIPRRRWSSSSTRSSARPSPSAPRTSTSSRWRTTCASATASTASCTRWPCRRSCGVLQIGDHLAAEGHGAHGHRREAAAAGWAHQSRRAGTSEHRRARLDHPDGERREHLAAAAHARRSSSSASSGWT